MGVPLVERLTSLSNSLRRLRGLKPKDLVGIQWRVAFGQLDCALGTYPRSRVARRGRSGVAAHRALAGETDADVIELDPQRAHA
jgi:hypothetical protein